MSELGSSIYEWIKVLFAGGAALWGLLFPLFFIFIPALLFWILLEIDFKKLIGLQCMALTIYLVEYALLIVWNVFFSIPRDSSPFSLGVAAQYVPENAFAIRFFSYITVFQIWMLVIQYRFLRTLEAKGPRYVFFHGVPDWTWLSGFICVIYIDSRRQFVLIKRGEHIEKNKETSMPGSECGYHCWKLVFDFYRRKTVLSAM